MEVDRYCLVGDFHKYRYCGSHYLKIQTILAAVLSGKLLVRAMTFSPWIQVSKLPQCVVTSATHSTKDDNTNPRTDKPRVSFIVFDIQSQEVFLEPLHIVGLRLDANGSLNSSFVPFGNQGAGAPAVGADPAEHARGVYTLDGSHHAGHFLIWCEDYCTWRKGNPTITHELARACCWYLLLTQIDKEWLDNVDENAKMV